jgi:hypothetical protein
MIPPQRKGGARWFCSMSVTGQGKSVGQVLVPGASYQTFARIPGPPITRSRGSHFTKRSRTRAGWRSKLDRAQTVATPAGSPMSGLSTQERADGWGRRRFPGEDIKPVLGSRLINIVQIRLGMGPSLDPVRRAQSPCLPQTPGRPRPQLPRPGSPWRRPVRVAPGGGYRRARSGRNIESKKVLDAERLGRARSPTPWIGSLWDTRTSRN